jgi:hypothetical protein
LFPFWHRLRSSFIWKWQLVTNRWHTTARRNARYGKNDENDDLCFPLMMLFFNSYASGLSLYYLFPIQLLLESCLW